MFRTYEHGCKQYKPTLRLICSILSLTISLCEFALAVYEYSYSRGGNIIAAIFTCTLQQLRLQPLLRLCVFSFHGCITLLYFIGIIRRNPCLLVPFLTLQLKGRQQEYCELNEAESLLQCISFPKGQTYWIASKGIAGNPTDLSTRHEILNEKNARPWRGRKRMRLGCDCGATGPVLHHIDAHASVARNQCKLPYTHALDEALQSWFYVFCEKDKLKRRRSYFVAVPCPYIRLFFEH
ncbi:hypothetical protein Y032_0003g1272 [Ancylostoma ceylanicum]|uniref:Uncharacterized protein n=1 Tax=Ancylostoma ceylanicum TaxID=53326 RepID=A0A016VW65_9BILA|nr:hypothetical protein Y032_0003g1272 [Ancylostoma ceylanicum]